MIKSISEYLDSTALRYRDKIAFTDEKREITFGELQSESFGIATALIENQISRNPVAIYMEKSVEFIVAMQGVACSGNCYCPIDSEMPVERIQKIFSKLEPAAVITDREHLGDIESISGRSHIVLYEDAASLEVDPAAIEAARSGIIDTDPLYILFTSGSTGMPKGAVVSHRALIDFTEWAGETFGVGEDSIIGNQTPLYFSMSIFDVYQTLRAGATMHIIPRQLFSFPVNLMQFLYDKRVNIIDWVPSALSFISAIGALDEPHLDRLEVVLFGGEVMPIKQLNRWRDAYPDVRFANLYGSTEDTDTCMYYEVNRRLAETDKLPIGRACANKEIFLLDEDDKLIPAHDTEHEGEICVRGTGLSDGYYNDPEKTAECFVQNPLHNSFRDIVYRTGDLARYNEYGELEYISRKDFQIKHMGHRIELTEIDNAGSAVAGVESCCAVYDEKKSRIILFYKGDIGELALIDELKKLVPAYMIPRKCISLTDMPLNRNGKIDRKLLTSQI